MANKISFILTCILFLQSLLFCGDLIGYQIALTRISAQSVYVLREIERDQGLNDEIIQMVKTDMNAIISCVKSDCSVDENNLLEIKIEANYTPLLGAVWEVGVPNIVLYRKVLILD